MLGSILLRKASTLWQWRWVSVGFTLVLRLFGGWFFLVSKSVKRLGPYMRGCVITFISTQFRHCDVEHVRLWWKPHLLGTRLSGVDRTLSIRCLVLSISLTGVSPRISDQLSDDHVLVTRIIPRKARTLFDDLITHYRCKR